MPAGLKIKFQINIIFNIFGELLLFKPSFRLFKKPEHGPELPIFDHGLFGTRKTSPRWISSQWVSLVIYPLVNPIQKISQVSHPLVNSPHIFSNIKKSKDWQFHHIPNKQSLKADYMVGNVWEGKEISSMFLSRKY